MFSDRELTPREAWIQLWGKIIVGNKEGERGPLITWIQEALTRTGKDSTSTIQSMYNYVAFKATNIHHYLLSSQCRQLLLVDFPNLGQVVLQAGH